MSEKFKLRKSKFETDAGVPLKDVYRPPEDGVDYERELGLPGQYPFTRGV